MSEKLYGILLQEAIPTPDKPQKIKNLVVNKEAKELIEKQSKEIERLNNLINTILNFDYFKNECPLNIGFGDKTEEKAQEVFYENDYCEEHCDEEYKKCWLKYFERLQELKGSDKE